MKAAITGCYEQNDRKYLSEKLIQSLNFVALVMNNKRFILDNNISYLDFFLFELVELSDFITEGTVFSKYPALESFKKRMYKLPRLKTYLISDECLKSPFHMQNAFINNWEASSTVLK